MLQRDAAANARFDLIGFDDEGSQSEAVEQRDFEYLRTKLQIGLCRDSTTLIAIFLKCWTLARAPQYFGVSSKQQL